jgi:hypothetical protein
MVVVATIRAGRINKAANVNKIPEIPARMNVATHIQIAQTPAIRYNESTSTIATFNGSGRNSFFT